MNNKIQTLNRVNAVTLGPKLRHTSIMPPRIVSLALAGRKLNAPPEGYGAKKEQQIKQWRKTLVQSSCDFIADPDRIDDLKVRH